MFFLTATMLDWFLAPSLWDNSVSVAYRFGIGSRRQLSDSLFCGFHIICYSCWFGRLEGSRDKRVQKIH